MIPLLALEKDKPKKMWVCTRSAGIAAALGIYTSTQRPHISAAIKAISLDVLDLDDLHFYLSILERRIFPRAVFKSSLILESYLHVTELR